MKLIIKFKYKLFSKNISLKPNINNIINAYRRINENLFFIALTKLNLCIISIKQYVK